MAKKETKLKIVRHQHVNFYEKDGMQKMVKVDYLQRDIQFVEFGKVQSIERTHELIGFKIKENEIDFIKEVMNEVQLDLKNEPVFYVEETMEKVKLVQN